MTWENWDADAGARLIAAAPELADLLERWTLGMHRLPEGARDTDSGWCNENDVALDSRLHSTLEGGCIVDNTEELLERIRGETVEVELW